MTSNPHPEHGPLWVERNVDSTAQPHRLRLPVDEDGDEYCYVTTAQADAIEAQLTPLPDGVYRERGGFRSVGGNVCCLPPEWQWLGGGDVWVTGDGCPLSDWHRVRRTPAEPPAPPTEDVPLHELCGWKLPGALWVVQSVRIAGRHIYAFDTLNPFEATISHPVTLNPDGTVTVQAQGVES